VLALMNVNRLVEDLGILIHHKCRVQGVVQDTRLDARIPEFQGDSTQLEQAFLNVILNSLEVMPEGGVSGSGPDGCGRGIRPRGQAPC
jgi:nitrogen-specific signal transduction histidine kinase